MCLHVDMSSAISNTHSSFIYVPRGTEKFLGGRKDSKECKGTLACGPFQIARFLSLDYYAIVWAGLHL